VGLIKRKSSLRKSEERGLVRDRVGLLAQLDGPVDSERRRAARDLVEHHDVSDALCRRLDIETEPSVRAVMFSSLTLIADQPATRRLNAFPIRLRRISTFC
jgi:hypothetical protein